MLREDDDAVVAGYAFCGLDGLCCTKREYTMQVHKEEFTVILIHINDAILSEYYENRLHAENEKWINYGWVSHLSAP